MLSRIFQSFTFRFLSAYVALLSIAVFLVLLFVYALVSRDYFFEVHNSMVEELEVAVDAYESNGVDGFDRYFHNRSNSELAKKFFYLVVDQDRNRLAGSLQEWPDVKEFSGGWGGFDYDAISDEESIQQGQFIARSHTLDSGETVLVARPYSDILQDVRLVAEALLRSMLATILLGTIGGALTAGISVKRIDGINQSLRRIMAGDLSERISDHDTNGDYRRLTENINKMLDTIEDLMVGVRRVSDNIAHDLRTPLTRIRNQLAMLESNCKEENREQLEQLILEADHLLATFSALLRISQVESGNKREGFTEVELGQILSDVAEMYEPLAYDKQQSFEMKLDNVPAVLGDRNLLFQVLANLVDNAIKYTPVEGHIAVAAEIEGGELIITVADSGMGIPEEDREKVFQRFYRIEESRGLPGNGLGLSLVRAVVRLHLGKIELQDNQPGLRVLLRFPIGKNTK